MKIDDINIKPVKEINITAYQCPYCSKKIFAKGSYRNHIKKDYCIGFYYNFAKFTNEYEKGKITYQEYLEKCYEDGCIELLGLDEIQKDKLAENFYNKIASLYNYCEEDY